MNVSIRKLITRIYSIGAIWTVFLLFGLQTVQNVHASKNFPFENAGFFLLAIPFVLAGFEINRKYGRTIEAFLTKHSTEILYITIVMLFLIQSITCYYSYFYSGWDAKIVGDTAYMEMTGDIRALDHDYYSVYPNNVLLVWIFSKILGLGTLLGLFPVEFWLVIFQCILGCISQLILFYICLDTFENYRFAWTVYLINCIFVGVSPWYIVAYSDVMGMIFPLLILRIYQVLIKCSNEKKAGFLWGILGFVSIAGEHIKPQVFIAFIAVVIIELICRTGPNTKSRFKKLLSKFVMICFGMVMFIIPYRFVLVPSLNININNERAFGLAHFFMMGLNEESDGTFLGEDCIYSDSFDTKNERDKADMKKALERIEYDGPVGLAYHTCRKQIVNYGDGTFAWAVEGKFFYDEPSWTNNSISRFLKSFIYPEGRFYRIFISSKQWMWIVLIVFGVFSVKEKNIRENDIMLTVILSIIGLTVFELLFEARARYLFCYASYFSLLGVLGMKYMYHVFKKWKAQ